MEDGYAICLNEWALDNSIKGELGLLLIISSLTAKEGFCYASNEYFAKLFKTTEQTISKKIKKLEQKNYITISYKKRGCEVISRKIRLTKMLIDDYRKRESTINENVKENNTSINNININNIKEKINKREKFKKPTIEEVQNYIDENSLNVVADAFIDYYESNGWKVGKNNMKDWRATVRGWARRQKKDDTPNWYGKELEETSASDDEIKELEERLKRI